MSVLVVDAIVAGKWFLPARGETLVNEAFHLLHQFAAALKLGGVVASGFCGVKSNRSYLSRQLQSLTSIRTEHSRY